MASLSREHHILRGMRAVKTICRKCVTCMRYHAKTETQLMGQLPAHRVNPGSPFEVTGIDFAGPITTKYAYVRRPVLQKSYACVFVCMATKAIHLEAVSELTTASFLASLTRFVDKRGRPHTIYSDNGTNFVGAERELQEAFQFMQKTSTRDAISDQCTTKGITWHFSPKRAPHFGGLWKAAVKAFKYHFRRLTKMFVLPLKRSQPSWDGVKQLSTADH